MSESVYYAMMGSERVGPMSLADLRNLPLTPTTPVWRQGMPNWVDASALPELADRFGMPNPPYNPSPAPAPSPAYGQPYGAYNPYPGGNSGMPPMPDNYLVWSIVVTILCCLPGGIVALIYSSKVSSRYNMGDYDGACQAANTAKNWCIGSAIIGILCSVISMAIYFVGFLGAMAGL